jgi:hypothetical protein
MTPLTRLERPEDIAHATDVLAGPGAGQNIVVKRGIISRYAPLQGGSIRWHCFSREKSQS